MPGGGARLIDEIERAGLRGRGGAGFPAATKLRTLSAAPRSIVLANGTEGEPASNKDKTLMAGSPHLVLDGLSIAAETIGASEAIICVEGAATGALKAVTTALAERRRVEADRVPIRLAAIPGGYVNGEESALVHWLNVPRHLEPHVRRAVKACPKLALLIQERPPAEKRTAASRPAR
jgi:NADH:ubiquinone oxidoreductase subunit F (NADH-binding)